MESCETCRFSRMKLSALAMMNCMRYPPLINPNFVAVGDYPIVKTDMWCGEYKSRDTE